MSLETYFGPFEHVEFPTRGAILFDFWLPIWSNPRSIGTRGATICGVQKTGAAFQRFCFTFSPYLHFTLTSTAVIMNEVGVVVKCDHVHVIVVMSSCVLLWNMKLWSGFLKDGARYTSWFEVIYSIKLFDSTLNRSDLLNRSDRDI